MSKRLLLLILAIPLLVGLAGGCASGPTRSPAPGPDWSRGVVIGESSLNDLVALCPEPSGRGACLAWSQMAAEGDHIHYVELNERAEPLQDRVLALPVHSPRQIRLLPAGDGSLLLCYLSGVSEKRRLFAAHLSPSGDLLGEPLQASDPELEVSEYAAAADAAGLEIVWSHNGPEDPGLYHLRLDSGGRPLAPSKLIVPGGISPSVQAGADGLLHLSWVQEPSPGELLVYYAPLDPRRQMLGTPRQVGSFALSPKATRYGPELGLSKDRIYIYWSWEALAGGPATEAGEAECHYVALPFGASQPSEERLLALPSAARPAYQPAQGAFAYSQLAPSQGRASSLVYMPSPLPGQPEEAALGVAFEAATRNKSYIEIGVVYLDGGTIKGYQVAGRDSTLTMRPVLRADQNKQLHVAWLQPAGFHHYAVYYASTSPTVRTALGRWNRQDLIDGAFSVVWTLVQGVSMFPLALVWLFLPLVWVTGYYVVRADGELDRRGPQVALAIAIALYTFAKFFLLPAGFMGAAPFVDRLSPGLGGAIVVVLPLAILAIALGAAWLYIKRSDARSLFIAYLVFGLTDCLLTFLLYGPGILG